MEGIEGEGFSSSTHADVDEYGLRAHLETSFLVYFFISFFPV